MENKDLYDSIALIGRGGKLLRWLFEHEDEKDLPEYSDITALDFSGQAMFMSMNDSELPESIPKLPNLESLELVFCDLVRIPHRIGNLKKLKKLDIMGNMIDKLPDSLFQCLNLEVLNISINPINALPENIGNLQNLQELYMTQTEIKSLPESFGGLKKLKVLHMYWTKIDEYPNSFFQLENLEELGIHFYKRDITEDLLKLPKLKEIHLTPWQVEKYPLLRGKMESKGVEVITDITSKDYIERWSNLP